MTFIREFILSYIRNLTERTSFGKQHGFDWIIYQLGVAKGWHPIRSPFTRDATKPMLHHKTSAEYGKDFIFVDTDNKSIVVFVLKDEQLKNKTWTNSNFDEDLRKACLIDPDEHPKFEKVRIILAYNKDEDDTGTQLFNKFAKSAAQLVADRYPISYEKWNIDTLTNEVLNHLLSQSILPLEHQYQFAFIIQQASSYQFASTEWKSQLTHQWLQFLSQNLTEKTSDYRLILVSLSILIYHTSNNDTPTLKTLDLLEIAIVKIFHHAFSTRSLENEALDIYRNLYYPCLTKYLQSVINTYSIPYGLSSYGIEAELIPVNDVYIGYWHSSHYCIHCIISSEINGFGDLDKAINTLKTLHSNNPCLYRPLEDIHHVDLFLVWLLYYMNKDKTILAQWFDELLTRLSVRKTFLNHMPFIEATNNTETVFENFALKNEHPSSIQNTSYLLLMLAELSLCMDDDFSNDISKMIQNIIHANANSNDIIQDVQLASWFPDSNWYDEAASLNHEVSGIFLTASPYFALTGISKQTLNSFVVDTNKYLDNSSIPNLPPSVLLLTCLRARFPISPYFWRSILGIYPTPTTASADSDPRNCS